MRVVAMASEIGERLWERVADMNVGWVGIAAADLNATLYWSQPFRPLASSKALCEYIVLDGESTGLSNGRVRLPSALSDG